MATTTRSIVEAGARAARGLVALAIFLGVPASQAQSWGLDFGVGSVLTWTSNSSFGDTGVGSEPASPDTILEVRPRLRVHGEGARLRLSGSASLGGIAYARRTQLSALEPTADLSARLEAIERLFFLEAGYRAAQTSANPFGVRAEGGSATNRLTTTQWRFSPVIEGLAAGDVRYALRSDNTWTHEIDAGDAPAAGAGGYFGRVVTSIERSPRPFGWRLEAERSLTRYDDPTEPLLKIATLRTILSYAAAEDWSVGIRAGYERNNVVTNEERWRPITGVETRWQPSARTTLTAFREKRFFGSGWDLAFAHRQPRLAWTLGLSRSIDTAPQELFNLPPTDNVAGLIDAMLTTRFPDPAERARIVQDYIAKQGLPSATQGAVRLFSPRFSIVSSRHASIAFTGVRNSLTLTGFFTRTEDALESGPLATGLASTNNTQRGASLVFGHRLSPLTALSTTLDWSRVRALDVALPDETTQQGLRVQVNLQAAPLTSTFVGGRYRRIESNVAVEGREGSVYVGLDHRF